MEHGDIVPDYLKSYETKIKKWIPIEYPHRICKIYLATKYWFYMNHLNDPHVCKLTFFGETTEFH